MPSGSDPLPDRVSKYVIDRHDATPDEVLRECELDESRRDQVEHYLAVTRYGIYKDVAGNDAEDLAFNDIKWADVADWSTPENPRNA